MATLALTGACSNDSKDQDAGTQSGSGASGGIGTGESGTGAYAGAETGGSGGRSPQADTGGSDGALGGSAGSNVGSGSGGGPSTKAATDCESPGWNASDFKYIYDVGPGWDYATPSDVPWETVGPSSLIRIHRRDEPYADKWVISVAATPSTPVVVLGVPDRGKLPEITGRDALTRTELDYWSETRGIIKIGGSSVPDVEIAEHVFVECLDVSGARGKYTFADDGGAPQNYDDNASPIYVEGGAHVTIRNNVFHDAGNGLFVALKSSDVLVSGNHIFDNGNVDSAYEHNSYTEAQGITFEFNHYGALCDGCSGNNLKDRSSGLVIRYNFIEDGNRALDLVDSAEPAIRDAADYDDTFVYGNVLIEHDGGNRQIIHYGGDGQEEDFRTGTLFLYDNTIISDRSSLATLVRLSSAQGKLDARNNVFFANSGSQFAVLEDAGTAELTGNWLPSGWLEGSPSLSGTVMATDNYAGADPGFVDAAGGDFTLTASSSARGITVPLPDATGGYPVEFEYGGAARATTETAGAFE